MTRAPGPRTLAITAWVIRSLRWHPTRTTLALAAIGAAAHFSHRALPDNASGELAAIAVIAVYGVGMYLVGGMDALSWDDDQHEETTP